MTRSKKKVWKLSSKNSQSQWYRKWVIEWEVPRKCVHSSIGVITLGFYRQRFEATMITPYLVMLFIPAFGCDLIRFSVPKFNNIYITILGPLMRQSEINTWNGVIFYLIGTWTVLIIFPKDIAVISILLLAWCDTAASTMGRMYGHYGPLIRPGKSLIGTIAACIVGMISVYLFWGWIARFDEPNLSWHPSSRLNIHELALLTGLIGGFTEQLDLWKLNDNCVIPVMSGSLLYIILKSISIFT